MDLRCEYLLDPAGIDAKQPRLSWRLLPTDADAYGQRQTACQVLVSDDLEALGKDQGGLWDSGQVASDQTIRAVHRGEPLTSRRSCFRKGRVKDERGVWSGWSEPARWTVEPRGFGGRRRGQLIYNGSPCITLGRAAVGTTLVNRKPRRCQQISEFYLGTLATSHADQHKRVVGRCPAALGLALCESDLAAGLLSNDGESGWPEAAGKAA